MTLPNEHLPLPCSLREVVDRCFPHPEPSPESELLGRERITGYLRELAGADDPPLRVIRRRAANDGGAQLGPADAATVEWITLAFDGWNRDYPVEAPLCDTLHRLLPLAIAVALKEPSFFTPGSHPLHTLLDRLQHSAVGWQARLDRAGQLLEQRVQRAVERALEWFDNPDLDFAAVTAELEVAAHRDEERAARMIHRLEETEEAAVRTRHARREAAGIINRGLASCELPMAIGEFLKGPWYDSLQLVALRHGTSSQEWREVSRITAQLMHSVQPAGSAADHGGGSLRRLSGELRHWLLSLQHDSAAADDAIGLVEYVHLRMSHGQDLGLTHIRPLPVPGEQEGGEGTEAAANLETGQWYLLRDDQGELRAQLSLQLEEGRHLLFTNAVGLKALDLDRAAFLGRLRDGSARHLPAEDSFSLSLSHAAGIDDQHKLRALIEPGYQPPETKPEPPPEPASEPAPEPAPAPAPEAVPDPLSGSEPDAGPGPESAGAAAGDGETAAAGPESSPDRSAETIPEFAAPEPAPAAAQPPGEHARAAPQREPEAPPESESTAAAPAQPERQPEPQPESQPETQLRPAPAHAAPARKREAESPLPSLELELVSEEQAAPREAAAPAREPRTLAPAPHRQPAAPERPRRAPPGPEMDVPMGAWLGFHDGETPIMAKLAVYDPRRDNYIFVNRRGIALRELSRSELLALIDDGLVDILETRSYFRDEVRRARERRDD
jgi:hypothetical protein